MEFVVRCRAFMFATVDLMTCLRVNCANHFDQLTISCLHSVYMTVVCVAVSVDSVVFLCGLPWNGDT